MRSSLPLVMLFAGSALLQGCATNYPHQRAAAGATVGAITGAVIGHQLDHKSGRFYGAALGALAGGAVGNYMDNQQRDLQQSLADERRRNQIQIQRMDDNSLKLTLDSEVSFAFDSAEIKPSFQPSLDKLAGLLGKYAKTRVRVVGHTDSVGSDQYNQDLSERRAFAVSDYLANRGVDPRRLTAEGRGEREPRASNATDAGRQLNRRVEIFVTPIVEGEQGSQYQEQPGYQEPNQPPPGYRQQPSYQGPSQQQPGYQQGPYQPQPELSGASRPAAQLSGALRPAAQLSGALRPAAQLSGALRSTTRLPGVRPAAGQSECLSAARADLSRPLSGPAQLPGPLRAAALPGSLSAAAILIWNTSSDRLQMGRRESSWPARPGSRRSFFVARQDVMVNVQSSPPH